MDSARIDSLRGRLEHRRGELLDMSRRAEADIQDMRVEREIEFGDEAQSAQAQARLALIGEAERSEVLRIDGALARMEAGVYGICDACGEEIEPRRLDAAPFAVRCAECAEAVSGSASRGRRGLPD